MNTAWRWLLIREYLRALALVRWTTWPMPQPAVQKNRSTWTNWYSRHVIADQANNTKSKACNRGLLITSESRFGCICFCFEDVFTGNSSAPFFAIILQAVNAVGLSGFSPVASISTLASSPAAVSGLRCASVTATSLSLSWNAPHCHGSSITHYNVEIGDRGTLPTNDASTTFDVNYLTPDTTYRFDNRIEEEEDILLCVVFSL